MTQVVYPKADEHVNKEIKEFLEHFASDRKIVIEPKSQESLRQRDENEKQQILDDMASAKTQESDQFAEISAQRDKMKEDRQTEREQAF